jgi:hypothetical protein
VNATASEASIQDVRRLPIDRLRRLAKEGATAAIKSSAAREIEARSGAGKPAELTVKVVTATTEYGTPQPELLLMPGSGTTTRELRASAYECAARAERQLSRSADMWSVSVRLDDVGAAVIVELMEGTDQERDRACALLRAVAPVQGPKKRGRKPQSAPAKTASAPARKTNGSAAVVA